MIYNHQVISAELSGDCSLNFSGPVFSFISNPGNFSYKYAIETPWTPWQHISHFMRKVLALLLRNILNKIIFYIMKICNIILSTPLKELYYF